MPLSHDELVDIQAAALADDVPILERMNLWTVAECEEYFHSGGLVKPKEVEPAEMRELAETQRPPGPDTTDTTSPHQRNHMNEAADANPMWCCNGSWSGYMAGKEHSTTTQALAVEDEASATAPPPNAKVGCGATAPADEHSRRIPGLVPGPTARSRPRLLCLHGSRSNAEATEMQMLIFGLHDFEPSKSTCACTFLEAPHKTGKFNADLETDGRSWLPDAPVEGQAEPAVQTALAGLRHIVEHCEREGGYDGGASPSHTRKTHLGCCPDVCAAPRWCWQCMASAKVLAWPRCSATLACGAHAAAVPIISRRGAFCCSVAVPIGSSAKT